MKKKKWMLALLPALLVAAVVSATELPEAATVAEPRAAAPEVAMTPADAEAVRTLEFATGLFQQDATAFGSIGNSCPKTNNVGCFNTGIVCIGYQCCCVYAGSDCEPQDRSIGPCWAISPI